MFVLKTRQYAGSFYGEVDDRAGHPYQWQVMAVSG
jgi:hypothetical protein